MHPESPKPKSVSIKAPQDKSPAPSRSTPNTPRSLDSSSNSFTPFKAANSVNIGKSSTLIPLSTPSTPKGTQSHSYVGGISDYLHFTGPSDEEEEKIIPTPEPHIPVKQEFTRPFSLSKFFHFSSNEVKKPNELESTPSKPPENLKLITQKILARIEHNQKSITPHIKKKDKNKKKSDETSRILTDKEIFSNLNNFSTQHPLIMPDKYNGLIIAVLREAASDLTDVQNDQYEEFISKSIQVFEQITMEKPITQNENEYRWFTSMPLHVFDEVSKQQLKIGILPRFNFIRTVTRKLYCNVEKLFAIKNKKKNEERNKDKEYQEIKDILEKNKPSLFDRKGYETFIERTIREFKDVVAEWSRSNNDEGFINKSIEKFSAFARSQFIIHHPPDERFQQEETKYNQFIQVVIGPITKALQTLLVFIKKKKSKKENKYEEYHSFIRAALNEVKQDELIDRSVEVFEEFALGSPITEGNEYTGLIDRATETFTKIAQELPVKDGIPQNIQNEFVKNTTAAIKKAAQMLRVIEDENEYTVLIENAGIILDKVVEDTVEVSVFKIMLNPPPGDIESNSDAYTSILANRLTVLAMYTFKYSEYHQKCEKDASMLSNWNIDASYGVIPDIYDALDSQVIAFILKNKSTILNQIPKSIELTVQKVAESKDKDATVKELRNKLPQEAILQRVAGVIWHESNKKCQNETEREQYLKKAGIEIEKQLSIYVGHFIDVVLSNIQKIQLKAKADKEPKELVESETTIRSTAKSVASPASVLRMR